LASISHFLCEVPLPNIAEKLSAGRSHIGAMLTFAFKNSLAVVLLLAPPRSSVHSAPSSKTEPVGGTLHSPTLNTVANLIARAHRTKGITRELRRRVAVFVCCFAATLAHAQDPIPGSLHTTPFPGFASGNGKIPALAIGATDDYARAVAVQPDGKIVLAGTATTAATWTSVSPA